MKVLFVKLSALGILSFSFFFVAFSFAASVDDIVLTEDTFSVTTNNESTDEIISESILLPVQRVGWGDTLIERAHEISICGNGIVELGEVCDKNQFKGKTCVSFNAVGGSLSCSSDCKTISTTACAYPPGISPTPIVSTPTPFIPTPIPTAVPTSTPSGGGGGGGYDPIRWATPTTIPSVPGASSVPSASPFISPSTTPESSLAPDSSKKPTPWLENGVQKSLWLENGDNPLANALLPFDDWREKNGISEVPSSPQQKELVTKQYISYIQSQLEVQKNTSPTGIASMLDGALQSNKLLHFGESAYWTEEEKAAFVKTMENESSVLHAAPNDRMQQYLDMSGWCGIPWIWLLIAFLLGMIIEYILYKVLFSKKYEK